MPNKIKFLSQEDVKKCLNMREAIDAMKIAFAELSNGNVKAPLRTNITLRDENSGALFMPVYFPSAQLVGLKSVMINKDNPSKDLPMVQAMYNVFDSDTGIPLAIMDGEFLTSMRTGAASGLATDLLAPEDSKIAVVFGAGVQAEKQIEAICEVRNFEKVFISDLSTERIKKIIALLQSKINAELMELHDKNLIKEADVISTATSSSNPVFDHSTLKDNVHINGIGSYRPDMCEIPHETVARSKLYVDSKEACLSEAGDIIQPIKEGKITERHIHAELGELVLGLKEGRTDNDKITIFKSVGNAVQDIAAASVILENSNKLNIGKEINL